MAWTTEQIAPMFAMHQVASNQNPLKPVTAATVVPYLNPDSTCYSIHDGAHVRMW